MKKLVPKCKNVHNMLFHSKTPICQNLVCVCQRAKTSCQTEIHGENMIFDIEINGQGHTEFMNVSDTSFHGDTITCQTKYDYVKGQKAEA